MAPSKSRKGRYKNVGVTKDADLLKESSPVKNMENGNKTDELKHPNKHLEEVILLISRSHNKEKRSSVENLDGDLLRKKLQTEKFFTNSLLLEIKDYFQPLLSIQNHENKLVYLDDALKVLRGLIDMLEETDIDQLESVTLACSLASKAFLRCFSPKLASIEELCEKAVKLMFHIMKQMYRKSYITGLVVIVKDMLKLLIQMEQHDEFFNEDIKKLFFTTHQMCYALYAKFLPNCIKTKSSDLTLMFELRAISLAVLSYADWQKNKFIECCEEFILRWRKILFQSFSYETEYVVESLTYLVDTLNKLLNCEESLYKRIKRIRWELTYLYSGMIISNNYDIRFDRDFQSMPWKGCLDQLDLAGLKNLWILKKTLMQDSSRCHHKLTIVTKILSDFTLCLLKYIETQEIDLFKIFDFLSLLKFAHKQQKDLCSCFLQFHLTFLRILLKTKRFFQAINSLKEREQKMHFQSLCCCLAETLKQLYEFLFTTNDDTCQDCKNDENSRLCIVKEYKDFANTVLNFVNKVNANNHEEDLQKLENCFYKISIAFNANRKYDLAVPGFCFVISFATKMMETNDNKVSDIKEFCGKYNALIQCYTKLEKTSLAYETSLQLLNKLKLMSTVLFGEVEPFLHTQVQYYVKLKFRLVDSNEKLKPKLLKSCLHDELEELPENMDDFWSVVLQHEYNVCKKQSSKYDIHDLLKRLVELRKELHEKEGDLLKYSLMMLEFASLSVFKRDERHHWCQEAVSILEEMHNQLCDSGDDLEWHVRDVLAVSYFQTSVMQYEEKVMESSADENQHISDIIGSCSEESDDSGGNLVDKLHEEDYLDKEFLISLNMAVELWTEICQHAMTVTHEKDQTALFQNGEQAAKLLYDSAVLYSLVSQNFNAIQAAYLSGFIYQILSSESVASEFIEKQTLAWSFAALQFLNVKNTSKGEALLEKLKAMKVESKPTQHQIDVTTAAYLLTSGQIDPSVCILKNVLEDLSSEKTKMAFTLKSDVFHLLSFLKLLPSAKKNEELSNEAVVDEHFPAKSPFPLVADSLKFLRSLYEACILQLQVDGGFTFSSSWLILDKLIMCLSYQAELLKQQGSGLEAKSYLKEALLLAKKFHLSFRVVDILQKLASVDMMLHNELSFNQCFNATTKILQSSVLDCLQDDDIYLPEFVTHVPECSCNYCVYPKLQEIHISLYLQYIESRRQFFKATLDDERCQQIVDALIENAKNRYTESFHQVTKLIDLTVKCSDEGNVTEEILKSVKRKVTKKKRVKKSTPVSQVDTELHYFSKYDVEAKIIKPSLKQTNICMVQTVEQLIVNMEKTKPMHATQHEFHRLTAQLYCLRSLLCLGEDIMQKHWYKSKSVESGSKTTRECSIAKKDRSQSRNKVEKKPTRRAKSQKKVKQEVLSEEEEHEAVFSMHNFIEDLKKALSVLNPYTDTLIIKAIYQILSAISGISDVNLATTSHLLSSARTLHQQIVSSCSKKIQKLKSEKKNGLSESKILSTTNILEKYSDPEFVFSEEKIQPLIDKYIPEGWCICTLSQSEVNSKKYLMISRVEAFKPAAIVNISLSNCEEQNSAGNNVVCDLIAAFNDDSDDLLEKFLSIQQQNMDSMKLKERKSWWNERYRLDQQLKSTMSKLENEWLQGWKGLLLGNIDDDEEEGKILKIVESIMDEITTSFGVETNSVLVKALINGFNYCSESHLLESLRFLFGDANAENALKIFKKHIKQPVKTKGKSKLGSESSENSITKRKPVILVLDKTIQKLPWESIPILRDQPISRMPSLLLAATHCMNNQELLLNGVSTEKTFYIVNPRNDLKRTEEIFSDWFKSKGWEGIVGKAPTTTEYTEALTENDLFIYCGHGSGQEYLRWEALQKLECRAVSILMGCSSGKLTVCGELEARGMVQYYLLAGCPTVVANLWDVTDKDIDLFLESLLNLWMTKSKGTDIAQCVSEARHVCKLPYLIGAAPVVYGLPIKSRN